MPVICRKHFFFLIANHAQFLWQFRKPASRVLWISDIKHYTLSLGVFFSFFQVWFLTQIYHPNVDSKGKICVDFLQDEWKPSFSISYGKMQTSISVARATTLFIFSLSFLWNIPRICWVFFLILTFSARQFITDKLDVAVRKKPWFLPIFSANSLSSIAEWN